MTICGTLACVAIGAVAERERRQAEAGQHRHLVVDDQFLGDALGDVGVAGVVLDNDLDLLAGHRRAVLLHEELDGRLDLPAGRGEGAGHRQDEPDLDRFLRSRLQRAGLSAAMAASAARAENVV